MPLLIATALPDIAKPPAWLTFPDVRPPWIRLWANTQDDEIALVVATLASFNGPLEGDRAATPEELEADSELALPGGLAAVDGNLTILPSCCAGLETWREWLDLVSGGETPWLGHDPAPWVERSHDGFTVWSDGGLGDPPAAPLVSVRFSPDAFASGIALVQADLRDFVSRLSNWSVTRMPTAGTRLSAAFARNFGIVRGDA